MFFIFLMCYPKLGIIRRMCVWCRYCCEAVGNSLEMLDSHLLQEQQGPKLPGQVFLEKFTA